MQRLFMVLLKPFVPAMKKIPDGLRNTMVVLGFLGLFLLFCYTKIVGLVWYNYYMGIGTFLLFWIVIWSLEGYKLKKIAWSKPITWTWFTLSLAMLVSEIQVPKRFWGVALLLLFLFPFLFFVWQNQKDEEKAWKIFVSSIQMTFILSTVFCYLFRPFTEGTRYTGFLINPNTFGMYLVTVFGVYLALVDRQIESGERVGPGIPNYLALGVSGTLVATTQSRTALLALVALFGCWFFVRLIISVKEKRRKAFIYRAGLITLVMVVTFPISYGLLRTVPDLVNQPVEFERDQLFFSDGGFGRYVNAEEPEEGGGSVPPEDDNATDIEDRDYSGSTLLRLWNRFFNPESGDISTGRFLLFQTYFHKINMRGHRYNGLRIQGVRVAHSHNNFIQVAYIYGIPSGILYALLMLLSLLYSIRFYLVKRRGHPFAFLPFAIVFPFLLMIMTEYLFLPFEKFPALIFWMVAGWLFPKMDKLKA